ncbi:hypothetical protein AB0L10_43275 [Streptomyces flaveolus]|uniref:hypothetical protein n=1 Tax=Streptomyces flaveolus TaxID=67297 RepID=UPI003442762F
MEHQSDQVDGDEVCEVFGGEGRQFLGSTGDVKKLSSSRSVILASVEDQDWPGVMIMVAWMTVVVALSCGSVPPDALFVVDVLAVTLTVTVPPPGVACLGCFLCAAGRALGEEFGVRFSFFAGAPRCFPGPEGEVVTRLLLPS